jgi:chromosome segregation ATPase
MDLIQHEPHKIPNPKQFLNRKLKGISRRQEYLKSIRKNALEYHQELSDVIEIAQEEYNANYQEIDEELQKAESFTALNEKIGELLDNLNEFEDYFSSTLTETTFKEVTEDELDDTINDLNEKYKHMIHVS